MTDSRTNYGKQISNLIRQAYGKHLKVFEQTIPRSVRAAETSAAGKSIFAYDPKGKVAEAYKSLAKEVQADADRQPRKTDRRNSGNRYSRFPLTTCTPSPTTLSKYWTMKP